MSVLQEYKCPCCDGAITFDSTIQKMKCPYCGKEIDGWAGDYGELHDSGYGCDTYWDEYCCKCPECGKEFRWFENYVRVEDDAMRMDE